MKICILGANSFSGLRVGANHIAESLSYLGHEVDYVIQPMSILSLFYYKSCKNFLLHCKLKSLNPNLNEIGQISLFPWRILKKFEGTKIEKLLFNLNKKFVTTKNKYIENKKYDICIFFASGGIYSLKKIKANKYIFRYQDIMEESQHVVPHIIIKYENYILKKFPLYSVAAVNSKLAAYIKERNKKLNVRTISNGINFKLFYNALADIDLSRTKSKNVIFIGAMEPWIDINLILDTAKILKNYYFHIYAKWAIKKPEYILSNVIIHDFIPYEEVPKKLKACSVGIIPFNSYSKKMFVQKPLKYYEYLASELGIVSTIYGMDKTNKFAYFANTPQEFADAIIQANKNKGMFKREKQEELKKMDWEIIANEIIKC